jgi:outer membrane scaffolding protein for murein synthesis (MipA/OmpV family)
VIVVAGICFSAATALARDEPVRNTPALDSGTKESPPPLPLWEAGLFGFGITQTAYPGADERVSRALALPYVIYRGRYLRADRGTVGLRALKTPRIEMDIGFAATLGSHSSDIAARQGMADLGTMIEFGPRLKIYLGDELSGRGDSRLQFPLREVIDISHGFVSRGIAFEPQWVTDTRLKRWFVSFNLGAMFGDGKLSNTYYGVAPAEATPTRPRYVARSGLIALRAGLFAAHPLSRDVRMFYLLRIDSLAGAANRDSPLVRRNIGWTAGIGLSWALSRSEQVAFD